MTAKTQIITNPNNPQHLAELAPHGVSILVASKDGVPLLETNAAIKLSEQNRGKAYPSVLYFPLADLKASLKSVKGKSTHCPLKGDAAYFSFDGDTIAWTYDRPLEGASVLKNYIAFYGDKVVISET